MSPIDADPESAFRRSFALIDTGENRAAREILETALARFPNNPRLMLGRAHLERRTGKIAEAVAWLERAAEAAPGDPTLLNNLGLALLDIGRPSEAIDRLRQSLLLRPDSAETHSNLIFAMDADPAGDAASQQRERRRWFLRHGASQVARAQRRAIDKDPERRLRVGYVSADFGRHSAAAIFASVVLGPNSKDFESVCYSANRTDDEATETLRKGVSLWRDVAEWTDDELETVVVADEVDILVDLSGHSGGGRLTLFSRKPAPIQVSAWGHATGTGIPSIDALFADAVTVPESERRLYAEKVEYLPCLVTFDPPRDGPAIATSKAAGTRGPIFGCFNRVAKLSGRLLEKWVKIVAQIPGARLLLKDSAFDDPEVCDNMRKSLSGFGLDPDRIAFRGRTDRYQHLDAYNDIDVALDPYPMNGGLSTLEALWMGVPVVALRGRTISGRGCASILTSLRCEDWIAETEDDYATIAKKLAASPQERIAFGANARKRMLATPLADPVAYVTAVEMIYRRLWREYCASRR